VLPQYGFDYWPQNAKLIQVDPDPRVLGLVKKTTLTVCGDPAAAARALLARLKNRPVAGKEEREKQVRAAREAWAKELAGWDQEKDAWSLEVSRDSKYMHPRQMLRELEKAMPEDAMVSTDIGNICQIANSYLKFSRPRSMFGAMMFGNCGYAFPAMIGCKVGAPERTAIAYVGDGAWGMSFGELLTCVREKIPVTAVVFNNQQWGAEKKNHVDFYSNRFLGVNLENPSFAGIAKAMGAEGITVDRVADVGEALRKACAAQRDGKTTVVEMMCTRELGDPFRRDALKLPRRLLAKYKSLSAPQ
jgi:sulfoacetaldehyde acetyltransferase